MITSATVQKRQDLLHFIERELESVPAVQGVIGIGSIASGLARPDSDIDAIIFLEPFDWHIVPAEFKWCPADGTFHSIFSQKPTQAQCLEFDFARLDLAEWAASTYHWPEGRCAEMRDGWLAYDRSGRVSALIQARTAYADDIRMEKLDEALTWLDQLLMDDRPQRSWQSLGPVIAHDRLQAAYDYLSQALFAYNMRWRPWRNREMSSLLALPWLPNIFADQIIEFMNPGASNYDGYLSRVQVMRSCFQAILDRVIEDGVYSVDAISEAFIRSHDEPGRAWNMDEWNRQHQKWIEHASREQ